MPGAEEIAWRPFEGLYDASKTVESGYRGFCEGAILSRLEMGSVLYFQRVTAISNHFRVSIRKSLAGLLAGVFFLLRGASDHCQFPTEG